jgi:protein-tyrosine phosphatase
MLDVVGVKRILNLVEDDEYRPGERALVEAALAQAEIDEYRLRLTDYGRLPTRELEAAVQTVCEWLDEGVRTYLHCRAGWQRSAAVAAGVVAVREGIDVGQALEFVRARKPSADPLPHQREDLRRWWDGRSASTPPAAAG